MDARAPGRVVVPVTVDVAESRPLVRALAVWAMLLVVAAAAFLVACSVGSVPLEWRMVFGEAGRDSVDRIIFFEARLPRVVFAMLAGGVLALAGAVYQSVLRNDLAEPYSLGVAGAATVGSLAVVQFLPGMRALVPVSAVGCALLALGVIVMLARGRARHGSPATLLLAGVSLNFLFGAIILVFQYVRDPYQTMVLLRWLMGGVDNAPLRASLLVACIVVPVVAGLVMSARGLNLLMLGDHAAHTLGVRVERLRVLALLGASLMAALVVAYAGPIGFVGLIVPHLLRLLVGADNRVLLPACVLGGGAFLMLCDTAARTLFAPTEVPVGILTAFLGAPFFLWILLRKG